MHLELAAGHLNAPVGPLVKPADLALALRTGSLAAAGEQAGPLLASLFVESSPQTLLACVREAGASLQSAQRLYEETLAAGAPAVAQWEEVVRNFS